jgi:uncharacterized cupin superfamily protein
MSEERLLDGDARSAHLDPLDLDAGDLVAGAPSAGLRALAELGGTEIGLWELTAGTVRDVEVDEVFVVLSGDATVRFDDGTSLELRPGVIVRLRAGERTEWEVRATLRKVYIATGD